MFHSFITPFFYSYLTNKSPLEASLKKGVSPSFPSFPLSPFSPFSPLSPLSPLSPFGPLMLPNLISLLLSPSYSILYNKSPSSLILNEMIGLMNSPPLRYSSSVPSSPH